VNLGIPYYCDPCIHIPNLYILHEFLCFRIDVANQIRGVPVDWALGAFIVHKSLNLTEYSDSSVSYLNNYDSSGLVPLLFIDAVVVFTALSILKWRRPRLRMIYDMEKGWYIITRVSR
jgi:apyrase